ncbi:MAG: hypothetical protein D4S01_07350 [Dehalococcoidia bacterium]|nr:MAG: hypothetical protein D4S01_07350 [Dehalococcoidia bacterium]
MFSVYLSWGRWKGVNVVPHAYALQLRLGYLTMCIVDRDVDSLIEGVLGCDNVYRWVKRDHIDRLEDRLIRTLEELDIAAAREADLALQLTGLLNE